MPVKSSTWLVPSDRDPNVYVAPQRSVDRIAAINSRMPRVNHNGFVIPGPDPSVVNVVEPPAAPPSMASALQAAAEACGADLAQLLDSNSFRAEIAAISPADSAALEDAVRFHMPAPAAPSMQPNRAQGASASGTVQSAPESLLERIHRQTQKALDQPLPPGSTHV